MAIQTFADRFIYATNITLSTIDSLSTDEELTSLLPSLEPYINQVKSHSVLLQGNRFSYRYIYDICTQDSDARIALIIAAAKDLSNNPMFPNLEVVKELMFGPSLSNLTIYDKDEYNIFVDGIRRVSAALTASKLVNQLATIDEQFKHANAIEKQAIADMDRLIKLNSIKSLSNNGVSSAAQPYVASLYFEIKDFLIASNESLKCEVYLPSTEYDNLITRKAVGFTSWVTSFTLNEGNYSTSDVVALISDTINSITLNNRSANILAAPLLSNVNNRHEIKFDARLKSDVLAAEIISLRFTYVNNIDNNFIALPFKWGNNNTLISNGKVNSVLLAVQNGKVASTTNVVATQTPVVLYIKRSPLNILNEPLDWEGKVIDINTINPTSKITLRLSTVMDDSITVDIPYIKSTLPINQVSQDKERHAQVADIIVRELFKVKSDTRTLGTLFRSDSPDMPEPLSAVELICFTARNPDTWTILDILELPPDIYIATGDLRGPTTPFSNNARAIRVNTLFVSNRVLSGNVKPNSGESSSPGFVTLKKPKALSYINDRVNRNRFL